MSISKIETPREFFVHVVVPDVTDFASDHGNLRAGYHAAISLLSYRDWVLAAYGGRPWTYRGASMAPVTTKAAFQQALEGIDRAFAIVREVANASKHMILESTISTMTFSGAYSGAPYSVLSYSSGRKSYMHVKVDDAHHDVPMNVDLTYRLWIDLNAENSW